MELSGNVNNLSDAGAIAYLQEQERIRRARSKRRWITAGAILAGLFVLMVGCGIAVGAAASGGSTATASAAPTAPTGSGLHEETRIVPAPPAAITAPAPAAPAPAVPSTDAEQAGIYDEGTYVVGRDIAPGDYWTGGPTAGGYAGWYRLSGLGGTVDEIIAVDSGDGPMQITILASDKAVKFTGSGQWVQVS